MFTETNYMHIYIDDKSTSKKSSSWRTPQLRIEAKTHHGLTLCCIFNRKILKMIKNHPMQKSKTALKEETADPFQCTWVCIFKLLSYEFKLSTVCDLRSQSILKFHDDMLNL